MADVAKSGTPSLSTVTPCHAHSIVGLVAGEAIAVADACYIKSDGKVWRSTGAAATAPAKVRGFPMQAAAVNEPITLLAGVNVRYGAGMTPGQDLFLSGAVAGALADAASTGGTAPIGFAIDATRARLYESRY